MAEICANGYRDALRFLQENGKNLQKQTSILDFQLHLYQSFDSQV